MEEVEERHTDETSSAGNARSQKHGLCHHTRGLVGLQDKIWSNSSLLMCELNRSLKTPTANDGQQPNSVNDSNIHDVRCACVKRWRRLLKDCTCPVEDICSCLLCTESPTTSLYKGTSSRTKMPIDGERAGRVVGKGSACSVKALKTIAQNPVSTLDQFYEHYFRPLNISKEGNTIQHLSSKRDC